MKILVRKDDILELKKSAKYSNINLYIHFIYYLCIYILVIELRLVVQTANLDPLINNLQGILKKTRKKCRQVKCENERMNEERHCPAYAAPPPSSFPLLLGHSTPGSPHKYKAKWGMDAVGCGLCVSV